MRSYYLDEGGILCYPDGRVMTPLDAAGKINELVRENIRYRDRLHRDRLQIDELQQANDFLRHRAGIAEAQVEEWRRVYSQPICNLLEVIGEYVDVMGGMIIPSVLFLIRRPVERLLKQPVSLVKSIVQQLFPDKMR